MTRIRYVVVVGAMGVAILINMAALYLHTDAQAASNRAGLVVQYKDGRVATRCVTFTEPEITGYDLLRRANMQLIADVSGGGLVCKIGDTGCNFPAQQCFCDCQDLAQTCVYWIYYFQANGAWKYSSLGPFTQKVTNGSVNGWIYGLGSATSAEVTPPMLSLDEICKPSALPTAPAVVAPPPTKTLASTSTAAAVTSTAIPTSIPTIAVKSTATSNAPLATITLLPTLTTSVQPAVAPVAVAKPTSATAPVGPTPPATSESPAPEAAPNGGYAVFAVIAIILVVGLVVAQRSIGKNRP